MAPRPRRRHCAAAKQQQRSSSVRQPETWQCVESRVRKDAHVLTVHKDSMVAVSKLFYFHAPEDPNGALTPLLIFIEHLSSPPELVHNFMLTFSEV